MKDAVEWVTGKELKAMYADSIFAAEPGIQKASLEDIESGIRTLIDARNVVCHEVRKVKFKRSVADGLLDVWSMLDVYWEEIESTRYKQESHYS